MNLTSMKTSLPSLLVCLMCLVSFSGCGPRLSVDNVMELASGEVRSIIIDSIANEQTVSVAANSSVPFSLHVHLAGDEADVDAAVLAGQPSPKILAESINRDAVKLQFTVPAAKEAVVRFSTQNGDAASISYRIIN